MRFYIIPSQGNYLKKIEMQGLKRSSGTQFSPEESGFLGQDAGWKART